MTKPIILIYRRKVGKFTPFKVMEKNKTISEAKVEIFDLIVSIEKINKKIQILTTDIKAKNEQIAKIRETVNI